MKDFSQTANRDEYYRSHTIAIDCVELHLKTPAGANIHVFLCSGGSDLSFDTNTAPIAGVNVYQAQGDFLGFSSLTEDFQVSVGKFSIFLSGINTTYASYLMNNEIEGKRVCIYKAFLNFGEGGGSALQLAASPILMFDGIIYNFAIVESEKSCQITIDCSSLFADFERTAGRKSNNWSNWFYQGVKGDMCFDKAGWVGQTEFKWGRL
jgi:hypothetical protein